MRTNSPKAWITAVRPYSLGNAVIVVAVAAALAWHNGVFHALPTLLALLFAVGMQAVANLVNDLCDFLKGADGDNRKGSDRAMAKGFITLGAMKRGIAILTAASCAAGLGLLWWALENTAMLYGGRELVATGIACIIFAYLYTAGPWPLAYLGLGDAAVVIFFGIVPIGFTYYTQSGAWPAEVTLASLACGLVIDTMLMVNNFRDRDEDALCNKRTFVVRFGAKAGSRGYLMLGVTAAACTLALWPFGLRFAALMPLVYLASHIAAWREMVRIDHGRELNASMGATARNIWFFGALLTLGTILDTLLQ